LKTLKKLRTAILNSKFTGSYKKVQISWYQYLTFQQNNSKIWKLSTYYSIEFSAS